MNKIIRFNDSEKLFRCPICKRKLKMVGNSLLCSNKHCFDISKLGYVNFALNQKQSKHYSILWSAFPTPEKISLSIIILPIGIFLFTNTYLGQRFFFCVEEDLLLFCLFLENL